MSKGAISIIDNIAHVQRKLNIKGHICEIGVHHGKLFILLYLLKNDNETAVVIDLFDKQYLNIEESGKGNLNIFLKNVNLFAKDSRNLKIITTEDSTQILSNDIKKAVGGEVRLFRLMEAIQLK